MRAIGSAVFSCIKANIGFRIYSSQATTLDIVAGRMKSTVLLLSILLGILATVQGQNTSNETVSSDQAVSLGVDILTEFENGKLQHIPSIVTVLFFRYTASVPQEVFH